MNLIKKILLLSLILIGVSIGNQSNAQVSNVSKNTQVKNITPSVEFTPEDIAKIKTLVERQLKRQLSDAQFSIYAKATKENLTLYQKINTTQKDNPFFSQAHITFILESMEERLGSKKPLRQPKSKKAKSKIERNPKVSKIKKGTHDNF